MKLITDEKLAKLIEDAFAEGYMYANAEQAIHKRGISRQFYIDRIVKESLQKASEQ